MVDIVVSRPGGGLDVTRRNPRSSLYVTSADPVINTPVDNTPVGSIRFVKRLQDRFARIEEKAGASTGLNAVWNKTGMQFSGNSIELGNNLILEGAAHFLKTENSSGTDDHAVALIPHIPFSDAGSGFTHSPVLDVIKIIPIFDNPVPPNEFIGTLSGQEYTIAIAQIIDRISYRAGTVSASAPVLHQIFQGTDNTGLLIHEVNLPGNFFFAEESIDSVTNSAGKARFNFTPGPTLTVGQPLSVQGYLSEVEYNTVESVSATGSGFFELENVDFQGGDTGGLFTGAIVEMGSDFGFSSEQVDIFIEMSSAANFSLQRNAAASPNVITRFKTQELKKIDLIMDELVLSNELDITIDNDLNFVTHNRFP